MSKTVQSNGKEKEHWVEEKLLVEAQELAQVRENIANLSPHIEHVEDEPKITQDFDDLGVHSPSQQAQKVVSLGPTLVLPLTSTQIKRGLHENIFQALRWLAVWCIKIAVMAKAKGMSVIFGSGQPVTDNEILEDEKEAGLIDAGTKSL